MKAKVEQYEKIGIAIRSMKQDLSELVNTASGKVPKSLYMPEIRAIELEISKMCNALEERMFKEHPDLPDRYTKVFYGTMEGEKTE